MRPLLLPLLSSSALLLTLGSGCLFTPQKQVMEVRLELSPVEVKTEGEVAGLGKEVNISLRENIRHADMIAGNSLLMGTDVNCEVSVAVNYYLPNTLSQVECWLEGSGGMWAARIKDEHSLEVVRATLTTPVEMQDKPKITGEIKSIYMFVGDEGTEIRAIK